MNLQSILTISKKEILEIWSMKYVSLTSLSMVLLFGVLFPLLIFNNSTMLTITNYQIYSFIFLGILNIMAGLTLPIYTAADTFAGENERRTLERLLATPVTDKEVLIGKIITCVLPNIFFAFLIITLSSILSWNYGLTHLRIYSPILIDSYLAPSPFFYTLELLVACSGIITSTCIMALVSSKVHTLREATQIGSIIIIPLFFVSIIGGIIISPLIIIFLFPIVGNFFPKGSFIQQVSIILCLGILTIFILMIIPIFYLTLHSFNREKLIAKI